MRQRTLPEAADDSEEDDDDDEENDVEAVMREAPNNESPLYAVHISREVN